MSQKGRIIGIGGLFFKSANKQQTQEWYAKHLGLTDSGYGVMLPWREKDNPEREQMTIWKADCSSARVSVSPRLVAVASSSRSRNTGAKRAGTGPYGVSRPTSRFGTRYVSSARCSHVAHASSAWL